jgi:hypothetical protein
VVVCQHFSSSIGECRYSCIHSRRVAQAEFKHSRTSFVAEAGVIVATVGAASLSLIVPVAEAVPETIKSSLFSSIVSAVVGTLTVPVVAPAGTVTVTL